MGFSDILKYGYADGKIEDVIFDEDDILVKFRKWDNKKLIHRFVNCCSMRCFEHRGVEIGEVVVYENSEELDIFKFNSGFSASEIACLKQVVFYNAWDDRMEVASFIAEDLVIEEEESK